MRNSYYQKTTSTLPQFAGFVPRWYLPSTTMYNSDNPDLVSTQTLAIINSTQEIEVGVGYAWKPVIIGDGQVQLPTQLAQYLGASINDTVYLSLENVFGSNYDHLVSHLRDNPLIRRALLTAASELGFEYSDDGKLLNRENGVTLDPTNDFPSFNDVLIEYEVVGTYDKTNGKFSAIFGNVAIVDCAYFFNNTLDAVKVRIDEMPASLEKLQYEALIKEVRH